MNQELIGAKRYLLRLSPVFPMHSLCCVFSRNTLGPHNSWLPQSDVSVTWGCCHDLYWICGCADYRYSLLACPHQTNHSSNPLPVRAWARWARCCGCAHISASECLLLRSSNFGMQHQITQQLLTYGYSHFSVHTWHVIHQLNCTLEVLFKVVDKYLSTRYFWTCRGWKSAVSARSVSASIDHSLLCWPLLACLRCAW